MVLINIAGALASLATVCAASAVDQHAAVRLGPMSVFETAIVPSKWTEAGNAHPQTTLELQIGLKQSNMEGLEAKMLDISNPSSPNYGKWLTREEIETYTKPQVESVDLVKLWLAAYDIPDTAISQPTADWITVKVPLSKAEELLSTSYSMYKDTVSGHVVPRTMEYSVPSLLHKHIDIIQPTTAFSRRHGAQQHPTSPDAVHDTKVKRQNVCDPENITPDCIQSFYNVDYSGKGKAYLGVTGLTDCSASHRDASDFLNQVYPRANGTDFYDVSISGGRNKPDNPCLEGNLDVQIALALGYPSAVAYLAVGPNDHPQRQFGDELVNLGVYLNSDKNPPSTVSTSYGGEEQTFDPKYLDRICNEFMKAGSRGVSVLFASGDTGVGGNGEADCSNGFYAAFPASCPWITSIGATQFDNHGGEIVAQFPKGGSSGGGFSYHFPTPQYQQADTDAYIGGLRGQYDGLYNAKGRGYPDLALVGKMYPIVLNGQMQSVYGTSASSPAWASLIALINDDRLSNGKPTLGFLNPLLYGSPKVRAALHDIVTGNNRGCNSNGFYATQGWDPASGLGSLDFGALRKALRQG